MVSRLNGCEYCASVHQARSKEEGGDAAVAITRTPFAFGRADVDKLKRTGLDQVAIIDVVNSSAFFNWANRLMLTLGEPDVPKRYR